MGWFEADILSEAITTSILIVLATTTLYKVIKGTRFKEALWIVSLILMANIGYFINNVAFYKVLVNFSFKSGLFVAIGLMVGDLGFNISHWLFAWYQFKVAKNMPKVITGKGKTKSYRALYLIGLVPNILFPVCEGVF